MGEEDNELLSMMMPSMFSRFLKQDSDAAGSGSPPETSNGTKYPDILPILPLRGVVVYPQTAVPLTVGQPRSIKLVDDVVGGDKLVGLVAAINPELESPGPADLYRVGTIATVHRLLRAPDGTIRLLVQGMARFRLGEFVSEEPYLKARIELAPEVVEAGIEMDALARNARDQFQQITQMIPSFPEELASSITSVEDSLQTAYTIANFQRMDIKDSQGILELDSVAEKLKKLIGLLVREAEVLQLGQKIQNEERGEIGRERTRDRTRARGRDRGRARDRRSHRFDDLAERAELRHRARVHLGEVRFTLAHGAQDLDAFDRVDAQIRIQTHLQTQHLGRITGLLGDHLQ